MTVGACIAREPVNGEIAHLFLDLAAPKVLILVVQWITRTVLLAHVLVEALRETLVNFSDLIARKVEQFTRQVCSRLLEYIVVCRIVLIIALVAVGVHERVALALHDHGDGGCHRKQDSDDRNSGSVQAHGALVLAPGRAAAEKGKDDSAYTHGQRELEHVRICVHL